MAFTFPAVNINPGVPGVSNDEEFTYWNTDPEEAWTEVFFFSEFVVDITAGLLSIKLARLRE